MYDTLLVPADGSDASAAAVEHALELADAFDASIHAVFAVEVDPGIIASGLGGVDPTIEESVRAEGEEVLSDVRAAADERGVPCEHTVETGDAHEVIADAVDSVGPDAVVMGTHGRDGVDRALVGSTAQRTVQAVDVPVLSVPPEK
jgi:nucleotide-binding universal stress UspA family protein